MLDSKSVGCLFLQLAGTMLQMGHHFIVEALTMIPGFLPPFLVSSSPHSSSVCFVKSCQLSTMQHKLSKWLLATLMVHLLVQTLPPCLCYHNPTTLPTSTTVFAQAPSHLTPLLVIIVSVECWAHGSSSHWLTIDSRCVSTRALLLRTNLLHPCSLFLKLISLLSPLLSLLLL